MWEKISAYFSAGELTGGLLTALAGSAFLYLDRWGLASPWIDTPAALLFFTLLLLGDRRHWFWSGLFLGLFWFGWIGLSFLHYGHPWAIPFVSLAVALVYALLFWLMGFSAEWAGARIQKILTPAETLDTASPAKKCAKRFTFQASGFTAAVKALWLWLWSLVHPFGFDWFKPELTLVHTPFGVDGLHFALLLAGLLALLVARRSSRSSRRGRVFTACIGLLLLLAALHPQTVRALPSDPAGRIALAGTRVPVERKWLQRTQGAQIRSVFALIDRAIAAHRRAVFLPESVLPFFLNREPALLKALEIRSRRIDIVLGALYLSPDHQNRNSAYHFHDGHVAVADKVVLVPFGEANPLPHWASRWVNQIFFDGAPDYKAAKTPTDFLIDGEKFRAAVCFEGTSERLYADRPARMVLLSNDGWFTPSIEPTLQKLLLEYYHRKYGTEIWHAVNGAPSYVILTGKRDNRGSAE